MKVALFVLLAIAVTANANMLRTPLLAVCRGDAPASKCCEYKKGEDHDLYLKPKGQSSCCNKNIGMWVPSVDKALDNQYCNGQDNTDYNFLKRNLKEMASTAIQFKRTLEGLKAEKKNYEAEFRSNYVKHEKHENKNQKKLDDKIKMMHDKENEAADTKKSYKQTVTLLDSTLKYIEKSKASFITEWNKIVVESKQSRKKLVEALDDVNKMEAKLIKETDAFAACKIEDKKKKMEVDELQKVIKEEMEAVKSTSGKVSEAEINLEKTKLETEEQAKAMNDKIQTATDGLKGMKADEEKLAKDLDGLAGLLAKAEEKLKASAENLEESEKKLAAESLLEVQGPKGLKGLAGKVKAGIGGALKAFSNWWNKDCNEDCQALKAYSAKNYIKNRQDDAAVRGQPVTLTKIFTDNLASMAKRLSHMEDVAKRYEDLHAHDVNLHQEIMAQIDAQFKDVKDKMKVIEAQIAAFETKRATNQVLIEKLNKELQSMMQAQNEKISSEKRMIEKNNKDTKNLISRMELLAVRVGVVAKQNAACKAGVEMLKKDVASKKKEQELIEKKQKELEGKLAAVEKETQRVKDKSSEHQAKLESELQQVEDERKETDENIQRFTEDLSDGKAKGKAMMAKTKENGNQQEANEKALKKKKDAKNDALDAAFD